MVLIWAETGVGPSMAEVIKDEASVKLISLLLLGKAYFMGGSFGLGLSYCCMSHEL